MEDRFKFRAWDTEEKEMNYFQNKRGMQYNNDEIRISNDWDGYDNPKYWGGDYDDYVDRTDKYILMQCTGIKDVKGNLIYEGDILKVVNGSINGIGLSDKWEVKWVGNGWNISQWSFDCTHSYEVIGNIYQNKELLKEKK